MTLDNFYTECESDKKNLIKSFENDMQCFVINSKTGNGATHLMMGIAKQLEENVLFINYEKLINNNEFNSLELESCKHLFLDSWNGFYLMCNSNNRFSIYLEAMEEKIRKFIKNGGRVYMTGNLDNMNDRLLNYVNGFYTSFVILDKVEKEVLSSLLKDFDKEYECNLEKRFGTMLLNKNYYSYRVFQNELIHLYANIRLSENK